MYYFLAHFPKIDYSQINEIRKKYDPNYSYIDPHIALVFPIDSSFGEQKLINHIEDKVSNCKTFNMVISGLEKSWDYYLLLTVNEGKDQRISLHDNLYSGLLSPFWLKEIPYKPHITLGFFADRQAKLDKSDLKNITFNHKNFNEAVGLSKSFNIKLQTTCNNLTLISREDRKSPASIVKEFVFKD